MTTQAVRIRRKPRTVRIGANIVAEMDTFDAWRRETGLQVRNHQTKGMEWCLRRELDPRPEFKIFGGILADEMGLGKTFLMLGCILSNFRTRTLIVVPPSLLGQWAGVIQKWLGHRVLVYHGSGQYAITKSVLRTAPLVLTTYGMIATRNPRPDRADWHSPLWDVEWSRVIYDEAHHLRNIRTGNYLGARRLSSRITWLVTGTPIQNKKGDLYALCSILGIGPDVYRHPASLRRVVRRHLLRRTKIGLGIKLPPLKHHVITIPWKSTQEQNMARDIHSLIHFSAITASNANRMASILGNTPLALLVRARQSCILPLLIHQSLAARRRAHEAGHAAEWELGVRPYHGQLSHIPTYSKMNRVIELLTRRRYNRRRKIVFCHYSGEITLLMHLLRARKISACAIDGRVSRRARQWILTPDLDRGSWRSVCKKWKNYPDFVPRFIGEFLVPDVLLMQIQTSNEGLNLQHFQEIYFTSPHWNPAVEAQATARAHRMGQTQAVDVFRLLMQGFGGTSISLDDYCLQIQEKKKEVIQKFGL